MNKKLEELKQTVNTVYRKGQINAADADDLTSLINAEIARIESTLTQRITDDVQAALELLEKRWGL